MICACNLGSGTRVVGLPAGLWPRFLSGLSKSDVDAVLSIATHRRFPASSVIVHVDDPADRFFLLTGGLGRHFILTSEGRRILLFWLTPGQIFGGMTAVSTPSHYLASTELLSDSCALIWDRRTIRELLLRFPRLLDNLLSVAATEHAAWLIGAYTLLSSNDASGRVAHMLVSLACGIGKAVPDGVEVPVSNEDLAAVANVTLFTVSRVLRAWQRKGILKKKRGRVILFRPELLATQWGPLSAVSVPPPDARESTPVAGRLYGSTP